MKRPSFYLNERIQAAGAMESRSRGARLDEAAVTKGQGVYVYDHPLMPFDRSISRGGLEMSCGLKRWAIRAAGD